MPTFSIITPLFNKGEFVKETINSVIVQSFGDWEMLVIDNGSQDKGAIIVGEFYDPRINLLGCEKRGPGAARNMGLQYATGKWVLFLDADDLIEKDYLKQQFEYAQQHLDADIIVGGWKEFHSGNLSKYITKHHIGYNNPHANLSELTVGMAPWAVHAAIVKRSIILQGATWPENLDHYLGEDIAFWFNLLNTYKAKLEYSDTSGALYRKNVVDCRTKISEPALWFEGINKVINYNINSISNNGKALSQGHCETLVRVYSDLCLNAVDNNNHDIARRAVIEARNWLKRYFQCATQPRISMHLRRFMGLRIYIYIQSLFRHYNSIQ